MIHGGLQQWRIEPVRRLPGEFPMFLGASVRTAFNDNAAATCLAMLAPDMTEGAKHTIVAGAVTGGGLAVIANSPNPAGQAILDQHFKDGVSPPGLFWGSLARDYRRFGPVVPVFPMSRRRVIPTWNWRAPRPRAPRRSSVDAGPGDEGERRDD